MMLSSLSSISTLRRRSCARADDCYEAHVASDYVQVESLWERLASEGAALPFQRSSWLSHWYAAHRATHDPLLVTLTEHGKPLLALPLALSRRGSLRIIGFADGGVTDYNAPILGRAAPSTAPDAARMMAKLLDVLPPADLLLLDKMPERVGGRINPLAIAPKAMSSQLNGNVLHVPGAWEDWHKGLERTFRKELERSLRVFSKFDGAQFCRFDLLEQAAPVYAALKQAQGERIRALGLPYILDEPEHEAFYDGLFAEGLPRGDVVLTALTVNDDVVAALLGVTDGKHYAMVRLATGGDKWKGCSPGRLLIERTMKLLHEDGYRSFDFTIGDYAYKRRMGVTATPLREMTLALSWRGWETVAKAKARRAMRSLPLLLYFVRMKRGSNQPPR